MLRFVTTISIIGCGGIGSWLLGPLLRFLNADGFAGEIVLWDGDRFAPENSRRQDFTRAGMGRPKAEAMADRFRADFCSLKIWHRNEYVSAQNVSEAVRERALIISCVDNHPARALLARQAETLRNVCILSAGNEKLDGNVCVSLRKAGCELTTSVLARHPELAMTSTGDRTQMGCAQLLEQGESQILVTNFVAAAATLSLFHLLWTQDRVRASPRRKTLPQEVFFDVQQCAMSLVPASQEWREA